MTFTSSAASRIVPVVFWMGVVFLASTDLGSAAHTGSIVLWILRAVSAGRLSLPAMEEIHFLIRKTAHLTEYGILGALLWRAFSSPARPPVFTGAAALIVAALYACSDEYHQSFVPSRTSSIRDVAIDTVGAAVGVTLCWCVRAALSKRPEPPAPGKA